MAKKEERFIRTYFQRDKYGTEVQIWVDRQTGVNYLFQFMCSLGGGLTPLLNQDGTPVITPIPNNNMK